ncbi:MAG: hypothetical protein HKO05_04030 [Erythrobacter sp.]|jgi:hypothetical protein|nr:hypothetical protein [Erythrobacter sp.]
MMKKIALILATGSLLAGGAVLAQPTGDRAERGPMTREAVVERTDARFAKMDANGDGVLNTADREARLAERFARMDADSNGAITQAEFMAAAEARGEMRKERREARAEKRGGDRMMRRGGRGGRHGHGMMMMKKADTNQDGQITKAEFQAAALARFDKADADGNGTLTAEERRAAHKAMRAQRRGN